MNNLTWELVVEANSRPEAELIGSLLRAHGLDVELFQEALGHHIYPLIFERVQVFTPRSQAAQARELISEFLNDSSAVDPEAE